MDLHKKGAKVRNNRFFILIIPNFIDFFTNSIANTVPIYRYHWPSLDLPISIFPSKINSEFLFSFVKNIDKTVSLPLYHHRKLCKVMKYRPGLVATGGKLGHDLPCRLKMKKWKWFINTGVDFHTSYIVYTVFIHGTRKVTGDRDLFTGLRWLKNILFFSSKSRTAFLFFKIYSISILPYL